MGCATCHVPSLTIDNPIFSEPSQNPSYRDGAAFPAGQSTVAEGVTAAKAIKFDLTRDQPDNVLQTPNGDIRLGAFRRNSRGGAIVELHGDLKRHFMGPRLREPVNEIAGDDVTPIPDTPRNNHTPETFLTENLWGVGSTAPYLHDGRATTLAEAIIEHGSSGDNTSEGRFARANFINATNGQRLALIAYLENLVLFKIEEEEEAAAASTGLLNSLIAAPGPRPVVKIAPKGFKIVLP